VSVVVVFGVGVDIGVEAAVTGVSSLGVKIKQGDVLLALQTEEDSAASSEESIAEVVNTEPKIIPVMVPDIGLRIKSPSLILSPNVTLISITLPATGVGISMDALSLK
jgi:hypothetical protein